MTKSLFLIAGEASGDALGGRLVHALKAQSKEPLTFSGIGGPLMAEEGLESLLDMNELCVMGVWEAIFQAHRLHKLINGVIEEIEQRNPAAVVTIDLPDFNFRVGARLKKRGKWKGRLIHYVAPSVWAWRPKRAERIARFLDGLICLFPFEPDLFKKYRLPAVFAGHPLMETNYTGDAAAFREKYEIPPQAKTLGLFFGSRISEIKQSGEVLVEMTTLVKERHPDLNVIVLTLPHLEYDVRRLIERLDCHAYVITNQDVKWDAFAACDAAAAVSGTVALELAFAGTPHIITYKTGGMTWMALKFLVKVKFAHLGNILLGEAAWPEFLQGRAKALEMGRAVLKLMDDGEERARQAAATEKLRALMGAAQDKPPSMKAAEFVLAAMNKKPGVKPPLPPGEGGARPAKPKA